MLPNDDNVNCAEDTPHNQSNDILHFFAILIRTSTVGELRLFSYADNEGCGIPK